MKKYLLALAAVLAVSPAFGLTPAQTKQLAAIEDHFSSIRSISADFKQYSTDGGSTEGKLYLLKPGRLKMVYNSPANFELIANGKNFIYYDKNLDQTTHLDISQTAANVILKDRLSFSSAGLAVTGYEEKDGFIAVTVTQEDDPLSGAITLMFSDRDFSLARWRITDAQGITTLVMLSNVRTNIPLDRSTFNYVNPRIKTSLPGD